jgi:hypothetical protein
VRRSRATLGLATAAVVLFAAGSILFVWLVDGSSARRRERVETPPAPEPMPVEPSSAPGWASRAAPPATAGAGSEAVPGAEAMTPAPEQIDPAWNRVHVAARLRDLGPVAPYVSAGLIAAREEMTHCFPAEPPPVVAPPAGPKRDDENWVDPAVLLLYLESRQGFIDVVEATVESFGTESPQVVSCCREVLRGHEIPAVHTGPGQRYRVKFPLY